MEGSLLRWLKPGMGPYPPPGGVGIYNKNQWHNTPVNYCRRRRLPPEEIGYLVSIETRLFVVGKHHTIPVTARGRGEHAAGGAQRKRPAMHAPGAAEEKAGGGVKGRGERENNKGF